MRRLPLAPEDLGLAAWNAAGVPFLAIGSAAPVLRLGDAPDPFAGWVQLLAVIGALVAIATRPAGATPAFLPGALNGRVAFIGPLVGSIAFVAGSASTYLGLDIDGPVVGSAFLIIVAAMVFGDRLPTIDAGLRRAFLVPFLLVSAGIFDSFAAELLRDLNVAELIGALAVDETGFGIFLLGMLVAGLAAFYAALVVAPRALIAPELESGCLLWPMRFVLYLVSALIGIGWLTAIIG